MEGIRQSTFLFISSSQSVYTFSKSSFHWSPVHFRIHSRSLRYTRTCTEFETIWTRFNPLGPNIPTVEQSHAFLLKHLIWSFCLVVSLRPWTHHFVVIQSTGRNPCCPCQSVIFHFFIPGKAIFCILTCLYTTTTLHFNIQKIQFISPPSTVIVVVDKMIDPNKLDGHFMIIAKSFLSLFKSFFFVKMNSLFNYLQKGKDARAYVQMVITFGNKRVLCPLPYSYWSQLRTVSIKLVYKSHPASNQT